MTIFQSARTFFARRKNTEPEPRAASAEDGKVLKARGNELLVAGQLAEATDCYRRAVQAAPEDATAHINLGYGLLELGDVQAARETLLHALKLDPSLADAHLLLGQAQVRAQTPQEAAKSFKSALALKPDFDFAWFELARVQEQMQDPEAAIDSYSRALAINPGFVEAASGKVSILLGMERWDEALTLAVAQSRVNSARIFIIQQACALNGLERYEEALPLVDGVLSQTPDEIEALSGKAAILVGLEQFQEAVSFYEQVLNAKPADVATLSNMASALLSLVRVREALAVCNRGLLISPKHANLRWGKALAHLLLGEFRQGWPEYEWRWLAKRPEHRLANPDFPGPMWQGEPVAGKTIFLTSEQGFGDTLQMLRYVPLLAEKGARVLLHIPAGILPLCEDLKRHCTLVNAPPAKQDYDYYCPLLSLPLGFQTELSSIPAGDAYLRSDPQIRLQWAEKFGPRRRPRIGLAWSGNAAHENDANRSIPLASLLAALPEHCELFSLQKEVRESDRPALEQSGIFHAGEALRTFADTAALVDLMDLVISVDTSVAHLAGALGKPLWIMLPYYPDWRWMLERDDSPWYPSARLFRQAQDRDWRPVFDRIAGELIQTFPSEQQAGR